MIEPVSSLPIVAQYRHKKAATTSIMQPSSSFSMFLLVSIVLHTSTALPLMKYLSPEEKSEDGELTTALAEIRPELDDDLPYIRYGTVMPVLKVVLTPIGRMVQPMIEQWIADRFGPYIDSIGRAVEGVSRYATDNLSFQTGDTYYTKSDLIDGYGYNSLIINLPSGKTMTVLTSKSKRKLDIFDELPQLSEALNEVRKLK
ncbi:uncharacterized protein LOC135703651 [Ochlerotatus camptorhynchus]|uniref:uncharacterized protein LOC135703651 n=1 Tax=Ochlerotatus camptorhynchus TaxID=644619 RepID=UPI0031DF5BCA